MAEEPEQNEADDEQPEGALLPDREMMSLIKTIPVDPPTIEPLPVEKPDI